MQEASPPFTIPKVPGQFSIMLVDRGPADADPPCWLISKAYNAQLAGADAVLIANDRDGPMVTAVVPEEEDTMQLLDRLTISAALISKSDGDRLKSLYKSNEHVSVKISWANIIPQSSKVHMELWTNSNDECGTLCDEQRDFIHSMKPVAIALQQAGVLEFEPHYLLWTCPPGYEDSTECKTSCILGGQYCAPDPDGSLAEGYSGKDVLDFNIRQLCFARLSAKDGQPWLWWDYAESLFINCPTKQGKFTPECAREAFDTHGGPQLLRGKGLSEWEECIREVEYPDKVTKASPILDESGTPEFATRGNPVNCANERHVHLIEIKFCEDTRPEHQLSTAKQQLADL
ncbi:hypothetical protein DUNSADRAFT_12731 [Dunaliella salina]|uniref:PA domain-containing protein n=1 Tax=Dunaliella salina TaxID=3046 RepID=A0ABQ7GAP8_DUNSA|nr:hypothetical protein DUNSADRAFT_12731 [Dunaliella salina]|eukprot:KAF5831677.1 hypothetical protein DUNSADRAFT_12731 [Dunaliella salina]